jgi:hypothetical protein
MQPIASRPGRPRGDAIEGATYEGPPDAGALLFTLPRTGGVIFLQEGTMFRNILVPFDFGEASGRALEAAMHAATS